MEVCRHGGVKAWRCEGMVCRHGGVLAWRCVGMEVCRHGGAGGQGTRDHGSRQGGSPLCWKACGPKGIRFRARVSWRKKEPNG